MFFFFLFFFQFKKGCSIFIVQSEFIQIILVLYRTVMYTVTVREIFLCYQTTLHSIQKDITAEITEHIMKVFHYNICIIISFHHPIHLVANL